MKKAIGLVSLVVMIICAVDAPSGQGNAVSEGKRLFEVETFGGNGRTCRTCHSSTTGTLSPDDVKLLFKTHPDDPLFVADGSDDGNGHGTTRIRTHATILMHLSMASNVKLANGSTVVDLRRGIPTTLNMPAVDGVMSDPKIIMLDGRQPDLESQALGAITDHAQATIFPSQEELTRIKNFELTNTFFSSPEVRKFAEGGPAPGLPRGNTESEKRGRFFFEDVADADDFKHGACAACHSGPMLDETNLASELFFGIPMGTRFQNILVSFRNVIGNPVQTFVFNDGTPNRLVMSSPDPGRSLITGVPPDFVGPPGLPSFDLTGSHWEAFKIPQLRGIRDTGPYFHDNSAKTLEDVMEHYDFFFGPGFFTEQDKADIIAFLKLLR